MKKYQNLSRFHCIALFFICVLESNVLIIWLKKGSFEGYYKLFIVLNMRLSVDRAINNVYPLVVEQNKKFKNENVKKLGKKGFFM